MENLPEVLHNSRVLSKSLIVCAFLHCYEIEVFLPADHLLEFLWEEDFYHCSSHYSVKALLEGTELALYVLIEQPFSIQLGVLLLVVVGYCYL